jgi:hypothetical protein
MIVVFASVVQLAVIVNALVGSLRERFVLGAGGAILRALLLISGAVGAVWERSVRFPGSEVPTPLGASVLLVAAVVLGPLVSFVVTWIARRRAKDALPLDEEPLTRPFNAWLPVALIDAAYVVITVLAYWISDPF